MIRLLEDLQRDPNQHFHISSDYAGESGLGDIEISVAAADEPDNMQLSGLAVAPGTDVPPAEA